MEITRQRRIFQPSAGKCAVRSEGGQVVFLLDDKRLEMSVPVAVKVGLALCLTSDDDLTSGEIVVWDISGFEVSLLPETAMRIGASILRKADRADDWQRAMVH
jgi:hypothetical protein